ncbi:hypothetical protein CDCA_CDCA14G3919 [Cyanidium caldarium]|uniref:HIT-type domain-containing protein n=1 Tax=Cyanidium caldarium TaxID=2771 RepID=A0AAV9J015_CYACA|nr:hypothetical protein CDCA_CDCA14G3919 [Cyanidium caldarium]
MSGVDGWRGQCRVLEGRDPVEPVTPSPSAEMDAPQHPTDDALLSTSSTPRAHRFCITCHGDGGARYTCPGCRAPLCCLECYRGHARDRQTCPGGGRRHRAGYVGRREFDLPQLLQDYAFLDDVERQRRLVGAQPPPASFSSPRRHERQRRAWQRAARQRGLRLQGMPAGMEKRRRNTSTYDATTDTMYWRVEVRVRRDAPAETSLHVLPHCSERDTLLTLLQPLLAHTLGDLDEVWLLADRANHPHLHLREWERRTLLEVLRAAECLIEFPTLELRYASTDQTEERSSVADNVTSAAE